MNIRITVVIKYLVYHHQFYGELCRCRSCLVNDYTAELSKESSCQSGIINTEAQSVHKNIKSELFAQHGDARWVADQVASGRFVVACNVLTWHPVPSTFQWMDMFGIDGSKDHGVFRHLPNLNLPLLVDI